MHQTEATQWQVIKSEAVLYMAMDVGESVIKVAFSPTGFSPRMMDIPGKDWKRLLEAIEEAKARYGLPATCAVLCCHEAGRSGFWIHRMLEAHGVRSLVVDSASIAVNRRRRRAKTDRLDAQSLLRLLVRHSLGEEKVWSIIRVPDPIAEDRRRLHRERSRLKKEETGHRNRIRGLLAAQGLKVDSLRRGFDEWLSTVQKWDGRPLLPYLTQEIRREHQRLVLVWEQLREIEAEIRKQVKSEEGKGGDPVARKLYRLRGVGMVSSFGLTKEIFGWREFKNGKELGGLVGLAPMPFISGDLRREQGISKSGSSALRGLLIELAWSWLRFQPDSGLSHWFWNKVGQGGVRSRKVAVVALARKLLVALWHWVEHDRLPEGAVLMC
jgi:transposase